MDRRHSVWFKTTFITENKLLDDGDYEFRGHIIQNRRLKDGPVQRRELELKLVDPDEETAMISVLQEMYAFGDDPERDWDTVQ